jgi:hypothetical protein
VLEIRLADRPRVRGEKILQIHCQETSPDRGQHDC